MGLITQAAAVKEVEAIQIAATRAIQQTSNSFGSVMSDLALFTATTQPAAGFDAATTAEIEAIKAALIIQALAALNGMVTALEGI